MKVLFILPVLTDAYYRKRVDELLNHGVISTIVGFERNYYPGREWKQDTESLGFVYHGRYLQRLGFMVRSVGRIRFLARGQDVIYCFNLDTLLMAWFALLFWRERPQLVYEVADVKNVLVGGTILSRVLRCVERSLLARVNLLVATSQAYIDDYFLGIQRLKNTPCLVIENKLSPSYHDHFSENTSEILCKTTGKHRIGYFGLLRCKYSWEVLKEIAIRGDGSLEVYMRGVLMGIEELTRDDPQVPNVEFGGAYVNPDELADMYSRIDLAWIAHAHGKTNLMWSRSNRFYEACYFVRPMIAQAGTQDAKAVLEHEVGLVIDLRKPMEAVCRVLRITQGEIETWRGNLSRIPRSVYMYGSEHATLVEMLRGRLS